MFYFLRREPKPISKRARRPKHFAPGRCWFEQLEHRDLLSITLATINNVQQPGGKDVLVPLTAVDSSGLPVSYSFSSSDANLGLSLVSPGTPSLELSVNGTDKTGDPYSGTLILKLFDSLTPHTAARIEQLANQGFYNGTTFARVLDGLLAEGGLTTSGSGTGDTFPDEFNSQLTFASPGLLGLANSGADTNDEQFFITAIDAKGSTNPISLAAMPQSLDFKYTIFGQLVSGFDTFEKIMGTSVITNTTTNEISQPASTITITSAQIITDTQDAVLEISAPASEDGNSPTITVTATDSGGATTQQTFTDAIMTNTVVDPPFMGAVSNQFTSENTPVTFTLTSTDPSGAPVAYTVVGATSFAAPQNATVSINQATGQVTVTPATGFTGIISLLAGVRTASASNTYANYDTQLFELTVATPTATTPVAGEDAPIDLSSAFNRVGITADGAHFSGGLDGVGNAYSATNTGTSLSWNNLNFNLGPSGANNVVQAQGQTIALPQGQYSQLDLLATGVDGNQLSQTFTVNYTDGTSDSRTQNISDWFTPQNYSRESIALSTPYRNTSQGGADHRTFDLYGYLIYLNNAKTVSSITLPSDANVEVLAITMAAAVQAPANLVATAVASDEVDLSWTAAAGSNVTGYNVYRGTASGGEISPALNSTPLSPGTTTFQDTSVIPGNSYYYLVQAVSGVSPGPFSGEATATTPLGGSSPQVDLSTQFNLVGLTADGAKFSGGLDGQGNSLSATYLGSSVTAGGTSFNLGAVGGLNVVMAAGQTIALPTGPASQLRFLATATNGNQPNQTFIVTYTDGTTTTLTQSISDWNTPQNYSGETVAVATPYRNMFGGGADHRRFDVYEYVINLDSSKSVSSIRLPDNHSVEILAMSMASPIAAPTGLAAATAAPNLVNLSWTAASGTVTGYDVYRGTVPGGESATPLNTTPLAASATAYQDTTGVPGNTYYYVVKALSGSALSPGSSEASATLSASGSSTLVDLSSAFNLTGITVPGTRFSGGLDGVGNALSAANLGSSVTSGGVSFEIGPAGSNDVVKAAGQSVVLPAGQYSKLTFLATGVDGNQANQRFTVHYTDGTTTSITQSVSDWYTPQHYAGESVAVSTSSRNTSAGGADNRIFDVYSYTINLDSSKTVSSITLPNNGHVEILAVSLVA